MPHPERIQFRKVTVEIGFERRSMTLLLRTGERATRQTVTPIVRFSDGTTFRGTRVSEAVVRAASKRGTR